MKSIVRSLTLAAVLALSLVAVQSVAPVQAGARGPGSVLRVRCPPSTPPR
ncbi:MAG: hypothetical protein WDM77_09910 [Steroidobacteraceae bacterium]